MSMQLSKAMRDISPDVPIRRPSGEIRRILTEGTILLVRAEGVATSQDNYTGANAGQVGYLRNKELSHNRAWSAIKWIRESGCFNG